VVVHLERYNKYDSSIVDKVYTYSDGIAKYIADHIQNQGFRSQIIPCDERVKSEGPLYWKGAISHKALAKAAGLGWIGKCTLLITPNFGPRICLISILTDIPLVPGRPEKNKCGDCRECIKACPMNALVETTFSDFPNKLDAVLDVSKCGPYVEKTWESGNVCWNCLLACPLGKK